MRRGNIDDYSLVIIVGVVLIGIIATVYLAALDIDQRTINSQEQIQAQIPESPQLYGNGDLVMFDKQDNVAIIINAYVVENKWSYDVMTQHSIFHGIEEKKMRPFATAQWGRLGLPTSPPSPRPETFPFPIIPNTKLLSPEA